MKIVNSRYAQIGLALIIAVLLIAGVSGSAAAAGPGYHTVQPGQTLYSIASHYGTSVWAIACANGLYNPNYVYAGQVLIIPSGWDGGGCKSDHQYKPPQSDCGCYDNHASWQPQRQDGCGCDQQPPQKWSKPNDGCGCDQGQQGWYPKPNDGCGCDQQGYGKQQDYGRQQDGCGCNDGHASWYPQPKLGCYYTVRWGENLFRVALKYGISWVVLAQGNGLYNGNYIYAGQVLRVPCAY
jgi:LysM repeat protein